MKKRILSTILALTMLFSIFPVEIWAAAADPLPDAAAAEPADPPELMASVPDTKRMGFTVIGGYPDGLTEMETGTNADGDKWFLRVGNLRRNPCGVSIQVSGGKATKHDFTLYSYDPLDPAKLSITNYTATPLKFHNQVEAGGTTVYQYRCTITAPSSVGIKKMALNYDGVKFGEIQIGRNNLSYGSFVGYAELFPGPTPEKRVLLVSGINLPDAPSGFTLDTHEDGSTPSFVGESMTPEPYGCRVVMAPTGSDTTGRQYLSLNGSKANIPNGGTIFFDGLIPSPDGSNPGPGPDPEPPAHDPIKLEGLTLNGGFFSYNSDKILINTGSSNEYSFTVSKPRTDMDFNSYELNRKNELRTLRLYSRTKAADPAALTLRGVNVRAEGGFTLESAFSEDSANALYIYSCPVRMPENVVNETVTLLDGKDEIGSVKLTSTGYADPRIATALPLFGTSDGKYLTVELSGALLPLAPDGLTLRSGGIAVYQGRLTYPGDGANLVVFEKLTDGAPPEALELYSGDNPMLYGRREENPGSALMVCTSPLHIQTTEAYRSLPHASASPAPYETQTPEINIVLGSGLRHPMTDVRWRWDDDMTFTTWEFLWGDGPKQVTFPSPGRHTLHVQFQRQGGVVGPEAECILPMTWKYTPDPIKPEGVTISGGFFSNQYDSTVLYAGSSNEWALRTCLPGRGLEFHSIDLEPANGSRILRLYTYTQAADPAKLSIQGGSTQAQGAFTLEQVVGEGSTKPLYIYACPVTIPKNADEIISFIDQDVTVGTVTLSSGNYNEPGQPVTPRLATALPLYGTADRKYVTMELTGTHLELLSPDSLTLCNSSRQPIYEGRLIYPGTRASMVVFEKLIDGAPDRDLAIFRDGKRMASGRLGDSVTMEYDPVGIRAMQLWTTEDYRTLPRVWPTYDTVEVQTATMNIHFGNGTNFREYRYRWDNQGGYTAWNYLPNDGSFDVQIPSSGRHTLHVQFQRQDGVRHEAECVTYVAWKSTDKPEPPTDIALRTDAGKSLPTSVNEEGCPVVSVFAQLGRPYIVSAVHNPNIPIQATFYPTPDSGTPEPFSISLLWNQEKGRHQAMLRRYGEELQQEEKNRAVSLINYESIEKIGFSVAASEFSQGSDQVFLYLDYQQKPSIYSKGNLEIDRDWSWGHYSVWGNVKWSFTGTPGLGSSASACLYYLNSSGQEQRMDMSMWEDSPGLYIGNFSSFYDIKEGSKFLRLECGLNISDGGPKLVYDLKDHWVDPIMNIALRGRTSAFMPDDLSGTVLRLEGPLPYHHRLERQLGKRQTDISFGHQSMGTYAYSILSKRGVITTGELELKDSFNTYILCPDLMDVTITNTTPEILPNHDLLMDIYATRTGACLGKDIRPGEKLKQVPLDEQITIRARWKDPDVRGLVADGAFVGEQNVVLTGQYGHFATQVAFGTFTDKTVTGTVKNTFGDPIPYTNVTIKQTLQYADGRTAQRERSGRSGRDGTFSIEGVCADFPAVVTAQSWNYKEGSADLDSAAGSCSVTLDFRGDHILNLRMLAPPLHMEGTLAGKERAVPGGAVDVYDIRAVDAAGEFTHWISFDRYVQPDGTAFCVLGSNAKPGDRIQLKLNKPERSLPYELEHGTWIDVGTLDEQCNLIADVHALPKGWLQAAPVPEGSTDAVGYLLLFDANDDMVSHTCGIGDIFLEDLPSDAHKNSETQEYQLLMLRADTQDVESVNEILGSRPWTLLRYAEACPENGATLVKNIKVLPGIQRYVEGVPTVGDHLAGLLGEYRSHHTITKMGSVHDTSLEARVDFYLYPRTADIFTDEVDVHSFNRDKGWYLNGQKMEGWYSEIEPTNGEIHVTCWCDLELQDPKVSASVTAYFNKNEDGEWPNYTHSTNERVNFVMNLRAPDSVVCSPEGEIMVMVTAPLSETPEENVITILDNGQEAGSITLTEDNEYVPVTIHLTNPTQPGIHELTACRTLLGQDGTQEPVFSERRHLTSLDSDQLYIHDLWWNHENDQGISNFHFENVDEIMAASIRYWSSHPSEINFRFVNADPNLLRDVRVVTWTEQDGQPVQQKQFPCYLQSDGRWSTAETYTGNVINDGTPMGWMDYFTIEYDYGDPGDYLNTGEDLPDFTSREEFEAAALAQDRQFRSAQDSQTPNVSKNIQVLSQPEHMEEWISTSKANLPEELRSKLDQFRIETNPADGSTCVIMPKEVTGDLKDQTIRISSTSSNSDEILLQMLRERMDKYGPTQKKFLAGLCEEQPEGWDMTAELEAGRGVWWNESTEARTPDPNAENISWAHILTEDGPVFIRQEIVDNGDGSHKLKRNFYYPEKGPQLMSEPDGDDWWWLLTGIGVEIDVCDALEDTLVSGMSKLAKGSGAIAQKVGTFGAKAIPAFNSAASHFGPAMTAINTWSGYKGETNQMQRHVFHFLEDSAVRDSLLRDIQDLEDMNRQRYFIDSSIDVACATLGAEVQIPAVQMGAAVFNLSYTLTNKLRGVDYWEAEAGKAVMKDVIREAAIEHYIKVLSRAGQPHDVKNVFKDTDRFLSIQMLTKTYNMSPEEAAETLSFAKRYAVTISKARNKEYAAMILARRYKKVQPKRMLLDPSGYVFEGVEENRVQGVTATVLQNAGTAAKPSFQPWQDDEPNLSLRQENPQITGEQGRFAWMTPKGEWMVQFTGEGYAYAETKPMTVPPEHTLVNIGLVSSRVPAVESFTPYEQAALIRFDSWMQLESLTTVGASGDISLSAVSLIDDDGENVPGTLTFPDKRENTGYKPGTYQSTELPSDWFVKEVLFTADQPLKPGKTYTLTVSTMASSYAGVPMAQPYTAALVPEGGSTPTPPPSSQVIAVSRADSDGADVTFNGSVSGTCIIAAYDTDGRMAAVSAHPVYRSTSPVSLQAVWNVPQLKEVRVFLLSRAGAPLIPSVVKMAQ